MIVRQRPELFKKLIIHKKKKGYALNVISLSKLCHGVLIEPSINFSSSGYSLLAKAYGPVSGYQGLHGYKSKICRSLYKTQNVKLCKKELSIFDCRKCTFHSQLPWFSSNNDLKGDYQEQDRRENLYIILLTVILILFLLFGDLLINYDEDIPPLVNPS